MTVPGGHGPRVVAGVMSGTSVDGIDTAFVRLHGTGRGLAWEVLDTGSEPFDAGVRRRVLDFCRSDAVRVDDLARLHVRLAHEYAAALRRATQRSGIHPHAVGCHGQTVRHLPDAQRFEGVALRATLQLGDPSALAVLTGLPVVGDFRMADIALDGQGAPLVPYADWALLGHVDEHRIALNLGGIANVTVLPADGAVDEVEAFDTGPGNMVSDALCRALFDRPFDEGGAIALGGRVHEPLLESFLSDPWFERPPPRSTGRERFGDAFADGFADKGRALGLSPADLVATAAALTAESVVRACSRFTRIRPRRVLVSGGGVRNRAMMERLTRALAPAAVESTAAWGLDPDAKEAVAFAVLAHETLGGVPTGLPRVTGALRRSVLGKICLPG